MQNLRQWGEFIKAFIILLSIEALVSNTSFSEEFGAVQYLSARSDVQVSGKFILVEYWPAYIGFSRLITIFDLHST